VTCPRCQQDNPSLAEFCLRCGTPFDGVGPTARPYAHLKDEMDGLRWSLRAALDQQTATSEILRVIRSSPTDVQPVFDIIAERAASLCDAELSVVTRFDGTMLQIVALYGVTRDVREAVHEARARCRQTPTGFPHACSGRVAWSTSPTS
jgi:hypothetical protein